MDRRITNIPLPSSEAKGALFFKCQIMTVSLFFPNNPFRGFNGMQRVEDQTQLFLTANSTCFFFLFTGQKMFDIYCSKSRLLRNLVGAFYGSVYVVIWNAIPY